MVKVHIKVDPTWGFGRPFFGVYHKSQFVHQAIYDGFKFAVWAMLHLLKETQTHLY